MERARPIDRFVAEADVWRSRVTAAGGTFFDVLPRDAADAAYEIVPAMDGPDTPRQRRCERPEPRRPLSVPPDRSKPWEVRVAPAEDARWTKEVPKPGTS